MLLITSVKQRVSPYRPFSSFKMLFGQQVGDSKKWRPKIKTFFSVGDVFHSLEELGNKMLRFEIKCGQSQLYIKYVNINLPIINV